MTSRPLCLTRDGSLDAPRLLDDPRVARMMALLNRDGEETRIVGGAVRNALLGLPAGDIDLATTALPEAVMARAKRAKLRTIPTGLAHGTVTVLDGGMPFEVTTLREDVETDGRHAVVRFGRDFKQDAERRDFTVNALSVGPDGTLYDTTDGVEDLAAGRIRFIGDAATRIREDYLRILRFFRFHATYGVGPLDPAGLAAAVACRAGLDGLSRERVRAEVLKLLAAPGTTALLETLQDHGFLAQILGTEADVPRFTRLVAHEGDAADPLLRLAALGARNREQVDILRRSLRLSNTERDRLEAAVLAREAFGEPPHPPTRDARLAILFDHGHGPTRDGFGLARASSLDDTGWPEARERVVEDPVPSFPFTGRDVMAKGLKGPAVGAVLIRLRQAYRDAGFPPDAAARAALLDAAIDAEARSRSQPMA